MPRPEVIYSPSGRTVSLKPAVMGIINGTPDSFYAPSRADYTQGVALAKKMIQDGADILDIGGESSRPGSAYVSADEELGRIIPLIKSIREFSDIPISVDTRKASVARAAFEAGADWINDISALQDDPELGKFAAQSGMPVVLMHMRGDPKTMQQRTTYENPLDEVSTFLLERVKFALACGISLDKIILDPGIGFGKNLKVNLRLLSSVDKLPREFPILVGLSRKSFIHDLSPSSVEDRLGGSLAGALWAAKQGAGILRVHDVPQTVQALRVWAELKKESAQWNGF